MDPVAGKESATVRAVRARARQLVVLTTLSIVATACARQGPELVQPVGETHTTASSTGGGRPLGIDTPYAPVSIVVGDDVRRACKLPPAKQGAPRFEFESSQLRPRGDDILARLAGCVASGKLDDDELVVVGHTDGRGADSYNRQLGLYRAIAAKDYLVERGVPAGKLSAESHGARDARGTDDASWDLDHTIEIFLARGPGDLPR